MKLPTKRGLATIPRYASGYMYQFGHIYLLQQELLNKRDADWFRALELWHTARHEGIALNVHHYNTILQHCAIESSSSSSLTSNKKEQESISTSEVGGSAASGAPWYVALNVLRQMKRDALRADCKTVSLALSVLANHGRWEEAMNTFSYFSGVNQNNNNNDNSILQSDGGGISSSSSLSKMNVGKFSGVGVKMDSVCVAAVIRACLNSSTSSASIQSEQEQEQEEDCGKIKAEEFILSLRRLRNSSNRRTSRAKSEPGKNPKFSSSSEQSSSTSGISTTTTISNSVDELTVQTALAELQAYFAAVRHEQQQQEHQMILENQETGTMTTMAIAENHSQEADHENYQQVEQEELETVPVYANSRNKNISDNDRRKKTLLENWGTFFEKVNEKSPKR